MRPCQFYVMTFSFVMFAPIPHWGSVPGPAGGFGAPGSLFSSTERAFMFFRAAAASVSFHQRTGSEFRELLELFLSVKHQIIRHVSKLQITKFDD